MTPGERFNWITQRTAELIPEIAKGRPVAQWMVKAASMTADLEFITRFGDGTEASAPGERLDASGSE